MAKEKKPTETEEETKCKEEDTQETKTEKSELASVKAQLEEANEKLNKEHDTFLRTAAEYDNYRRRTAEEMSRRHNDGKAEAVEKILKVSDSVNMALASPHDDEDPVYKGLCLIAKQLTETLSSLGVTQIPTDIPFDPNLHNAVMHVDDEEKGEGEIVEVFQTGFKMGDRVLRHSMVKVAN